MELYGIHNGPSLLAAGVSWGHHLPQAREVTFNFCPEIMTVAVELEDLRMLNQFDQTYFFCGKSKSDHVLGTNTETKHFANVFGVWSAKKKIGWICSERSITPNDINMLAKFIQDKNITNQSPLPDGLREFIADVIADAGYGPSKLDTWQIIRYWTMSHKVEAVTWWQGRRAKKAREKK